MPLEKEHPLFGCCLLPGAALTSAAFLFLLFLLPAAVFTAAGSSPERTWLIWSCQTKQPAMADRPAHLLAQPQLLLPRLILLLLLLQVPPLQPFCPGLCWPWRCRLPGQQGVLAVCPPVSGPDSVAKQALLSRWCCMLCCTRVTAAAGRGGGGGHRKRRDARQPYGR